MRLSSQWTIPANDQRRKNIPLRQKILQSVQPV